MRRGSSSDSGDLRVFVDGALFRREEARVSVWDSGFQSGDAVYEGLRVYNGTVFQLSEHVERLFRCAQAIDIPMHISPDDVAEAILSTVRANGLKDDAHIRITVTRGTKRITGMNPTLANSHPTIVIIVEPKRPPFSPSGISLVTSSVRRTPAECLDPKLHTCNQLGQILAKIEANNAGADEALMLDVNGFIAETNSANIFVISGKQLMTPTRKACMPGLTRAWVLSIAHDLNCRASEEDLSLADAYSADEILICGTVCEIVPVVRVDGRTIGTGRPGAVTGRISDRYLKVANSVGFPAG